jgi:hypothetical protein
LTRLILPLALALTVRLVATMLTPTPKDIATALRDWVPAKKLIFDPASDVRGRPWSYGIRGAMVHHWAGSGDGGQEWMAARGEAYPYCNNTVRRDGRVIVLSLLSAWHSGQGGPWNRAGVPKDAAHLMVWGLEMEGPMPGTQYGVDDMTEQQWRNTARVLCAIREAAGKEAFPNFQRVVRHGDWTDGTNGVSETPLPTIGRKNDVWADTKFIRRLAKDRWEQKNSR